MEIFVFGSNLAGRHGKGAALYAARHYGAEYGVGVGRTGNAYAVPTKDRTLKVLPLDVIDKHMQDFLLYASDNNSLRFLLTPVGTGLAGYSKRDIWRLLTKHNVSSNVCLTSSWLD